MKITRKQLQRLIEGILTEMPKLLPELIPDGFHIKVIKDVYIPRDVDWFVHEDAGPPVGEPMPVMGIIMYNKESLEVAELKIRYWDEQYCGGTWEVPFVMTYAGAPDGVGPMMYDIAMELAGDAGIMSDRMNTSDAAARVWEFYIDNRTDVIKQPIVNCTGAWMRSEFTGRRPEYSALKFIQAPGSPSIIAALGNKISFT
jgi:hypothetical protein